MICANIANANFWKIILTVQKSPEYPDAHVQESPSTVPSFVHIAPFMHEKPYVAHASRNWHRFPENPVGQLHVNPR